MKVLLINPWIEDFSAYDLWLRPLNLLRLATLLRKLNIEVYLIDALDRHYPGLPIYKKATKRAQAYGTGHFLREVIQKPACLSFVPLNFKRYGIPLEVFREALKRTPKPDLIITSVLMTYWYGGAETAISECRKIYPEVPVWLGGIYPLLCKDHAEKKSSAAKVLTKGNYDELIFELQQNFNIKVPIEKSFVDDYLNPAYDLLTDKKQLPLLTTQGCPYLCEYCASSKIYKDFKIHVLTAVIRSIERSIHNYGTTDFIFYDDALLVEKGHIKSILQLIINKRYEVNFHTPNALHARFIDKELAELMKESGFKTIRLGLEFESDKLLISSGAKVSMKEYLAAMTHLKNAGFSKNEIGTYVLFGYPGEGIQAVRNTAKIVSEVGSEVKLALYSPIPGTKAWGKGFEDYIFDPNLDPLLTNNSLAPYRSKSIAYDDYESLKHEIEIMNRGSYKHFEINHT